MNQVLETENSGLQPYDDLSSYRTVLKIAGYSVIPSVARSVAEGEVEESCTPNSLRFLDSEDSARNDGSEGRIERACRSRRGPVAR